MNFRSFFEGTIEMLICCCFLLGVANLISDTHQSIPLFALGAALVGINEILKELIKLNNN